MNCSKIDQNFVTDEKLFLYAIQGAYKGPFKYNVKNFGIFQPSPLPSCDIFLFFLSLIVMSYLVFGFGLFSI